MAITIKPLSPVAMALSAITETYKFKYPPMLCIQGETPEGEIRTIPLERELSADRLKELLPATKAADVISPSDGASDARRKSVTVVAVDPLSKHAPYISVGAWYPTVAALASALGVKDPQYLRQRLSVARNNYPMSDPHWAKACVHGVTFMTEKDADAKRTQQAIDDYKD